MSATRISEESQSEDQIFSFNSTINDFFKQSTSTYIKNAIEKLFEVAK